MNEKVFVFANFVYLREFCFVFGNNLLKKIIGVMLLFFVRFPMIWCVFVGETGVRLLILHVVDVRYVLERNRFFPAKQKKL